MDWSNATPRETFLIEVAAAFSTCRRLGFVQVVDHNFRCGILLLNA
jgi:hypothetical protein